MTNVIKIVARADARFGYMSRHIQVGVEPSTQIPCRRHSSHISFTNLDAVDRHLSQLSTTTKQ